MTTRIKNKRKITPETAIKKQIKDYLSIKGWFHFPITQGLGAYKGICDRIAIKDGRTIYVEAKTPNGRQSDYQKIFQQDIETKGGEYLLVESIDDLMKAGV